MTKTRERERERVISIWLRGRDDPNNQPNPQDNQNPDRGDGVSDERPKCSRCQVNDIEHRGLVITIGEEKRTIYEGYLCDPCAKELLKCQECKTNEMASEATKIDGTKLLVCQECAKKIKEEKEKERKPNYCKICDKKYERQQANEAFYYVMNNNNHEDMLDGILCSGC
jgi:hypothetical protein